jgi:hypothetical protein
MQGALKGEVSDSNAYVFTIQSTLGEIEEFYSRELPKVGWQPLAVGEGETGNVLMMFTGDNGTFTVSILAVDESASIYYVILLGP